MSLFKVKEMRSITIITGLVLALSATFLVGCGAKLPSIKPYKMEIQQGNVVTSKMLLQLRPGMTKSQVRYIMGTPLVVDSFHDNRWDYFYELRQEGKVIEKRRVILDFDKEALVSVRGDVVAAGDKTAEAPTNTAPKSVTPPKKEESKSWLDRLKFWGGNDEKAVSVPSEPVAADLSVSEALKNPAKSAATAEEAGMVSTVPAVEPNASEAPASVLRKEVELPRPKEEMAAKQGADVPNAEITAIPSEPIVGKAIEAGEVNAVAASAVENSKSEQASADEASKQAVISSVNAWADAWRNKDVNQYVGAYADNYQPDDAVTHKAWVNQRKARIAGSSGAISLKLEDVNVQVNGNKATAQFFQKYSSNVYSDQVTKQLDFELDAKSNRWVIVKESLVAEASRPAVHEILAPDQTEEHLEGVIEKIGF
jgi:outer membrane protein assembly factor BamE (lipoprotein component of BamABCDE complex)